MKAAARWRAEIRAASNTDYERIAAVWSASGTHADWTGRESRQAFEQQLHAFADSYLVAVDGDRVIGAVLGSHDHRKGWINRLAVLPEYRRRGVAAALIQACEEALFRKGLTLVVAHVEPHNAASVQLFKQLGYRDEFPILYLRKSMRSDE